jgi:hypothetical protein
MPLVDVVFQGESIVSGIGLSVRKAKIGLVTLDASVNETHTKANDLTKHPVETGTDITDHIRQQPQKIEITGVISDTPLFLLASVSAPSPVDGQTLGTDDRVRAADKEFLRAMDQGSTLSVFTTLRQYANMVITQYAVTRDKDTGNILSFKMTLEEIVIVEQAQEVPVPKDITNGGVTDIGKKVPVKADAATDKDVSFFKWVNDATAKFVTGGSR